MIEAGLPSVAMELTDFSVFYSQDTFDDAAESLKNGKNKIVVEQIRIVKASHHPRTNTASS